MTSSPTQGIKTVLHPVSDLDKAKPVYSALLGMEPAGCEPQRFGRLGVQPIGVVERHEKRRLLGCGREQAQDRKSVG